MVSREKKKIDWISKVRILSYFMIYVLLCEVLIKKKKKCKSD